MSEILPNDTRELPPKPHFHTCLTCAKMWEHILASGAACALDQFTVCPAGHAVGEVDG